MCVPVTRTRCVPCPGGPALCLLPPPCSPPHAHAFRIGRPADEERFASSIFFRNSLSQRMDNPITRIPELPGGGHGEVIGIPRALGGRGDHEHGHGHGGHTSVPPHGPH